MQHLESGNRGLKIWNLGIEAQKIWDLRKYLGSGGLGNFFLTK